MKWNVFAIYLGLVGGACAGTFDLAGAGHSARVGIAFSHPERYADLGTGQSEWEKDGTLRALGGAMQRMAAAYLREDLQLEVQVRDIDLAGDIESWRGMQFQGVRVMRNVYPPRMKLDYKLRDARGGVLAKGEASLSNRDYLFGSVADTDPLRHDKALFRDWLRSELSHYRK